jgi:hypothetical protein
MHGSERGTNELFATGTTCMDVSVIYTLSMTIRWSGNRAKVSDVGTG